jgi:hypothetical protein
MLSGDGFPLLGATQSREVVDAFGGLQGTEDLLERAKVGQTEARSAEVPMPEGHLRLPKGCGKRAEYRGVVRGR